VKAQRFKGTEVQRDKGRKEERKKGTKILKLCVFATLREIDKEYKKLEIRNEFYVKTRSRQEKIE
jgi:hypothetical protein